MTILETALAYAKKGYSVIPVKRNKRPLIKWEPYQNNRASEEEIRAWFKISPDANVAIVTGEISNLFVVDTDSPESTQRISEAIPDSLMVPCQHTPSGGMHFLFSHCPGFSNRAKVADQIDIRTSGGYFVAAPSVNGNGKGWDWVLSPFDADPPELVLAVKDIIINSLSLSLYRESVTLGSKANIGESVKVTGSHIESHFFEDGRRDEDLIHAAILLQRGGSEKAFAINILNILVNSWGEDDPNWVEVKVKSAWDRAARRDRNIAGEFREWIKDVTSGHFLITNYQKESFVVTKQDKHSLIMAAKRFCEEGLLERVGNRTGEYRIRNQEEVEFLDFVNVSKEGSIPLILPLGFHKKTIFFPKNVIVIAGVTGYGKTSYMLNVIKENMDRFKFRYFMSEMSDLALNYKLNAFKIPISDWKMDVIPDDKWDYFNIHDKIYPDDINIIDYLEPEGERSFKIHEVVTKIIKKLNKGMALIATQKKLGADLSAGGVYSAKAASLYLSLDWGKIYIFKNRFREEDPNPLKTHINFEIKSGQNIVATSDWYDPHDKKLEQRYRSFQKED